MNILEDKKYRTWLRKKGCLLRSPGCRGPMDIHHMRVKTGMGRRSADIEEGVGRVLPLCRYHHSLFHTMGKKSFQSYYGIDMIKIAKELYGEYRDASSS